MTITNENASGTLASPNSERSPGVVLTMPEAAWASGFTREELQGLVSSGELKVRRLVRAGRVLPMIAMKELERVYLARSKAQAVEVTTSQQLRERVARLEGELKTSERVERALQRYTDRLEERTADRIAHLERTLAISRQREMTLARALGHSEGQVARLSEVTGSESKRKFGSRTRLKQSKSR